MTIRGIATRPPETTDRCQPHANTLLERAGVRTYPGSVSPPLLTWWCSEISNGERDRRFGRDRDLLLLALGPAESVRRRAHFETAVLLRRPRPPIRLTSARSYHQNTTRLVTTSRHLLVLIGTNLPAVEYETALANT
jgi:hypothetical protein